MHWRPWVSGSMAIAAFVASAPLATGRYTIRPGDTLSSIARAHGVSVTELAQANDLTNPNIIVIGRTLAVPGTTGPTSVAAPAATTTYLVRLGDTLSLIARVHGTTVAALMQANSITDPNRVYAGTRLVVPASGDTSEASAGRAPASAAVVHVVAPGDTLSRIAARYGTSAVAVAVANDLRDLNVIRIGQRLQIPGATPREVASGDVPAKLLANPDRLRYGPMFDRWAAEYQTPASLLKAMTYLESGWQHHVESSVGAIGIGQIMPATGRWVSEHLIGVSLDPRDPESNIRISARFLRYLLDLTGGDASMALAGYYQGLASVRRHGLFDDTQAYVGGVLALRERYTWNT